MNIVYVSRRDDPTLDRLAVSAFPGWNGTKIKLVQFHSTRLDQTWDGGSRSTYAFVDLDKFESVSPSRLTRESPVVSSLPPNVVMVEHSYYRGKDMGLTIHVNPSELNRLALPARQELDEDSKIVLAYTASYKNSYGGDTNIRFKEARHDTGISSSKWETAKEACVARKFLRKNGSITNEGRNALGDESASRIKFRYLKGR